MTSGMDLLPDESCPHMLTGLDLTASSTQIAYLNRKARRKKRKKKHIERRQKGRHHAPKTR